MLAGELEAEPEKHVAERTSASLHQEKQKPGKNSSSTEHAKKPVTSGVEEDAFFEME